MDTLIRTILDETDYERNPFFIALRDGFQQFDVGDRCVILGKDPDGDYPIMRFGVFRANVLVGAWWLGCNEILAGSTRTDVLLRSVAHRLWASVS